MDIAPLTFEPLSLFWPGELAEIIELEMGLLA